MTRKPKTPVINWQARADNFVNSTLLIAGRTVNAEELRRITSNVRKSFAPSGYHEFCTSPERCAGGRNGDGGGGGCARQEERGMSCNE